MYFITSRQSGQQIGPVGDVHYSSQCSGDYLLLVNRKGSKSTQVQTGITVASAPDIVLRWCHLVVILNSIPPPSASLLTSLTCNQCSLHAHSPNLAVHVQSELVQCTCTCAHGSQQPKRACTRVHTRTMQM